MTEQYRNALMTDMNYSAQKLMPRLNSDIDRQNPTKNMHLDFD